MVPCLFIRRHAAGLLLTLSVGPVFAAGKPPVPVELNAAQQAAIGIETMALQSAPLAGTGRLVFGGRVEFGERGPHALLAPTAARITGVYAHPGEHVKRGDPVLALAGPELLQARAALEAAEAEAAHVTQRLARDRALFEAGAIPRSRLEGTEAQERSARAAVNASRAAMVGATPAGIEGLRIRAPIDGYVMGRALAPGDLVAANEVLAYVADTPHIHAAVAVPVSIARHIAVKDGALVRSANCESTGSVHAVGRDVEPDSQAVAVHITLDDEACFAPGEAVSAKLAPRSAGQAGFAVPATAFVTHAGRSLVFLAAGERFIAVEVDPAAARAGFAQSPQLKAGERIVTRGTAVLKAEWLKSASP